ncbi:MAG: glycosyltransferase family 4 protein [Candidatus Gribaldobacteria bacterium]|nr:glycosyltransferase family 4 protein [Candidatus Gribaldobacteria bacterium]
MNLLLFNLATDANDYVLGFTMSWIRALAKRCDMVYVITMKQGRLELPDNVKVYSVGKEKGYSEFRRAIEFYRHLIHILANNQIDACFAHMMPVFAVMGAPLLKIKGIPIILWIAHGHTPPMLKLAEKLVNKIVTSTPEGCRLKSNKIQIIGQGIDTALFYCEGRKLSFASKQIDLLFVGRISPVKKIEVLLDMLAMLIEHNRELAFSLKIVGSAPDEKVKKYEEYLRKKVQELGIEKAVVFAGSVPHQEVVEFYGKAHFILNPSQTGSLDKTLLEGICAGAIPITSNIAYRDGLSHVNPILYIDENTPQAFCYRVGEILKLENSEIDNIIAKCQDWVLKNHSLDSLADKLMSIFRK